MALVKGQRKDGIGGTTGTATEVMIEVEAHRVGSAMDQCRCHALNHLALDRPLTAEIHVASQAAHAFIDPR